MTMSIKEIIKKSKRLPCNNKDIFIILIIIFVAGGSFGLGRLSKIDEMRTPINIKKMGTSVIESKNTDVLILPTKTLPAPVQKGGFYIGSKNGTKYHFPWCPGAKRIKNENKVIFNTKEEAVSAGYSSAKNCKGLD